ncbi:hypothetical protein DFH06DRAFT_1417230 [Mycena polygramma]|nr:hypothetical protein DFH06DRAFT_1417230 [Mycena polygramma]
MQTQYTVNSTALNKYWADMVADMSVTWVAIFFYAFYLNLFILSLYTLARRKRAARKVLLGFTLTMAVLGTAQMVVRLVTISIAAGSLPQFIAQEEAAGPIPKLLHVAQDAIFGINNFVADTLFLYRCYMIWGSQWKVAVAPGLLMLSTVVVGCIAIVAPDSVSSPGQPFERVPYITATSTNLLLIILTAGRIWWIRRDALHVGSNRTLRKRYSSVMAMIVESGAIYCATTILLTFTYPLPGTPFLMVQAAAMHLVNIVPTLIIVRVGLEKCEDPAGSSARQPTSRLPVGQARQAFNDPHSQVPVLHIKAGGDDLELQEL